MEGDPPEDLEIGQRVVRTPHALVVSVAVDEALALSTEEVCDHTMSERGVMSSRATLLDLAYLGG